LYDHISGFEIQFDDMDSFISYKLTDIYLYEILDDCKYNIYGYYKYYINDFIIDDHKNELSDYGIYNYVIFKDKNNIIKKIYHHLGDNFYKEIKCRITRILHENVDDLFIYIP